MTDVTLAPFACAENHPAVRREGRYWFCTEDHVAACPVEVKAPLIHQQTAPTVEEQINSRNGYHPEPAAATLIEPTPIPTGDSGEPSTDAGVVAREARATQRPQGQPVRDVQPKDARWVPRPLSALSDEEADTDWLLEGYIAPGTITSLTGLWKAGKTTMLTYLLRSFGNGESFAGRSVKASRVLIVSEESERLWVRRRDALSLGDHVEVISRPFLGRPTAPAWDKFIRHIAELVWSRSFDLVVFDSMPNLWPVRDENNAADVITTLSPMNTLTAANAAVLLLFHPRKGDAGEGQATRGTGATGGFVDVILELRRFDAERREDTRRTIIAYSRFEETPPEIVIEYDREGGTGYRLVGTKASARSSDRVAVALDLIVPGRMGSAAGEILARWPDDAPVPKPSQRTLENDLNDAVERGMLERLGEGRRGSPFAYRLLDPPEGRVSFLASSNCRGQACEKRN